jgi:SAM-dependent methyltransferase
MPLEPSLPLPPAELRFMSEDDVRVVSVGQGLAGTLRRHGLVEDGSLLDIGSGYGRLALGLITTDFAGNYHGIEILKKQVTWCQNVLSPYAGDRFRFSHLDVRNGRYNPGGKVRPQRVRFPAENDSCDNVALFSVFTHMYEADIARYLREIRRVLKPGGIAVTTWFLFDKERLPRVTSRAKTPFPMVNQINQVTRYSDPRDPLRAIAYQKAHVRRLVAAAGLELRDLEYGSWCGDPGQEFQDVLVLVKPLPPPPPSLVRRLARRARRAARRAASRL